MSRVGFVVVYALFTVFRTGTLSSSLVILLLIVGFMVMSRMRKIVLRGGERRAVGEFGLGSGGSWFTKIIRVSEMVKVSVAEEMVSKQRKIVKVWVVDRSGNRVGISMAEYEWGDLSKLLTRIHYRDPQVEFDTIAESVLEGRAPGGEKCIEGKESRLQVVLLVLVTILGVWFALMLRSCEVKELLDSVSCVMNALWLG